MLLPTIIDDRWLFSQQGSSSSSFSFNLLFHPSQSILSQLLRFQYHPPKSIKTRPCDIHSIARFIISTIVDFSPERESPLPPPSLLTSNLHIQKAIVVEFKRIDPRPQSGETRFDPVSGQVACLLRRVQAVDPRDHAAQSNDLRADRQGCSSRPCQKGTGISVPKRCTCFRPSGGSSIDISFTYSSRSPYHLTQFVSHPHSKPNLLNFWFDLVLGRRTFSMPSKFSRKSLLGLSLLAALATPAV